MSFKYLDPGFGLSTSIEGVDSGFYPPLKCVKSYTYNKKFGVAFHTDKDWENGFSRLDLTSAPKDISEFYLKFDEYFPENSHGLVVVNNNGNSILSIQQVLSGFEIRALNDSELKLRSADGDETYLMAGRVNTIWLHVKTGANLWTITVVINGETVFRDRESLNYTGATRSSFRFYIDEELPVSNLIISDEEISLNETIAEVGISAVDTTMIEESGTYLSAVAGDYVLQTLDPANLYNQFKPEAKVFAMVAIAAPAYRTGDDVSFLKCRVVDGERVTDYEILDYFQGQEFLEGMTEQEFATLEDYVPSMIKQISLASDTTISQLSGLKVGWVTGA